MSELPPRPSGPPLKPPAGPHVEPPPPPPPPPFAPPVGGGPPGWQDAWDEESAARYRRRRALLAVVGALAIAGLLAGTLVTLLTAGDDGDDATGLAGAETEVDPAPAPGGPGTTAPGPPPTEDELAQVVEEISAFVEDERGLDFREPVDVELAADDEFEERLLADFEEDAVELEETGVVLTAFGLVEPDVDVVEAMRSLLGAGVVGFYDPETAELVVRGTNLGPYVRSTVAHELVHALDDQHFDLDRPQYDEADDEIGFGFSAVVEGNARRVENAYMASLSEGERAQADDEAMDLALDSALDLLTVPPAMLELIQAPYERGEPLVEALLADGGEEALGRAFAEPPRTSEQVIDPDAYIEGEAAVEVPHPAAAGDVVDEAVAGQMLIELVLAGPLGIDGSDAADGWGGDWTVAWRDGDRSCVTMAVVGDTEADTDALRQAFDEWAGERDGATVTGGSGQPVTVESCVG